MAHNLPPFNPEAYEAYTPVPQAGDPMPMAHVVGAANPQSALHQKGAKLMDVYSDPRQLAFDTRIGNLQADCWWCMVISLVFICVFALLMLIAGVASTAN